MHFWIDKRSQCAYSGRHRVPSSLSAGVGRSRGRVCAAAGRKGMAAPVHRFAPVECAPRRIRPLRHYGPPPMPPVHSSSRRPTEESSLYVEIPPEPPQPTIASLAAARSVTPDTLLRTAALGLHHSPMMAPHLKFGMLVSFALAAVFFTCAKYYFDRHVGRGSVAVEGGIGEVVMMCAALTCFSGLICALSLCRATAAPPPAAPERVSSTARRPLPRTPTRAPTQRETIISEPENISLTIITRPEHEEISGNERGAGGSGLSSEAPPPYHIAVLLPARAPSPPPPAYSALS